MSNRLNGKFASGGIKLGPKRQKTIQEHLVRQGWLRTATESESAADADGLQEGKLAERRFKVILLHRPARQRPRLIGSDEAFDIALYRCFADAGFLHAP